jgi:hypothetical protein
VWGKIWKATLRGVGWSIWCLFRVAILPSYPVLVLHLQVSWRCTLLRQLPEICSCYTCDKKTVFAVWVLHPLWKVRSVLYVLESFLNMYMYDIVICWESILFFLLWIVVQRSSLIQIDLGSTCVMWYWIHIVLGKWPPYLRKYYLICEIKRCSF